MRVVVAQEQLLSRSADDEPDGSGFLEETGAAVPASFVRKQVCDTGTRTILTDAGGSPLDVGREQRLFNPKQRIALSVRDGGCAFPGCDRPPSYCESHHIDEWTADGGLTNVADGILLCRHHHMLVHNNGWRIMREGSVHWLIPPRDVDRKQTPIRLWSKSALGTTNPARSPGRFGETGQQTG